MVNKKGYIKTLEAIIAIILVLVVIFTVIPTHKRPAPEVPASVKTSQDYIIQDITYDEGLRKKLTINEEEEEAQAELESARIAIFDIIKENVPPGYISDFKICETAACTSDKPPVDRAVYMTDVFISASYEANRQTPRIVRVWFWERGA